MDAARLLEVQLMTLSPQGFENLVRRLAEKEHPGAHVMQLRPPDRGGSTHSSIAARFSRPSTTQVRDLRADDCLDSLRQARKRKPNEVVFVFPLQLHREPAGELQQEARHPSTAGSRSCALTLDNLRELLAEAPARSARRSWMLRCGPCSAGRRSKTRSQPRNRGISLRLRRQGHSTISDCAHGCRTRPCSWHAPASTSALLALSKCWLRRSPTPAMPSSPTCFCVTPRAPRARPASASAPGGCALPWPTEASGAARRWPRSMPTMSGDFGGAGLLCWRADGMTARADWPKLHVDSLPWSASGL